MKKILKTLFVIIISALSISVVYTMTYRTVFFILNKRAVSREQQVDFSEYGAGITWLKKSNKQTLFFIPSSEEIAVLELYGSWLKEMHEELSVNIIIPPFDQEGFSPYLWEENSSVKRRYSMTEFLYGLYSEQMGDNHKITVLSTGDGSLPALNLAAEFSNMDKIILISPVNNSPARRGGSIIHRMGGLPLVHYVVPWLINSYGKNRIGPYDILNDKLNEKFQDELQKYYPEFLNFPYERKLRVAADKIMMSLEDIQPNRFFIIYGDDDLTYGLEGFERMGDQLNNGGSEVSIMRIPQSGRMILFDNGRDQIIDLISILLQ
ncbi:MAG: hypothetical protein PF518_15345 [Spirochaetaceae bacterium]|jgi:pimeloyl-ACP methyl ester carboxylesterase|nr:hypothetical protein [Spirochaetaceae bacterium]